MDLESEVEGEQAETAEGMPEVQAGGKEPATITIPEGQEPPEELQEQVLIEGDGAEVEAGQALAVQYTGVLWDSGEKFDSSWDRGQTNQFPLTGLIAGWQEGIPGMKVGGRRQLTIPPEAAYGPEGSGHPLSGRTLVFIIDLISA